MKPSLEFSIETSAVQPKSDHSQLPEANDASRTNRQVTSDTFLYFEFFRAEFRHGLMVAEDSLFAFILLASPMTADDCSTTSTLRLSHSSGAAFFACKSCKPSRKGECSLSYKLQRGIMTPFHRQTQLWSLTFSTTLHSRWHKI